MWDNTITRPMNCVGLFTYTGNTDVDVSLVYSDFYAELTVSDWPSEPGETITATETETIYQNQTITEIPSVQIGISFLSIAVIGSAVYTVVILLVRKKE
ncbi:MAG: hypothetical protein FK733_06530 [Asgard group archaeon]|nr:hypothetical protein [Asgard group archaeon]